MTTFDERETAFENKFAHQQTLLFFALARSNKLLGLWAASILGKSKDAADAYAASLVHEELRTATPGRVLERVAEDLHNSRSMEAVAKKHAQLLADVLEDLYHNPNQRIPNPTALP